MLRELFDQDAVEVGPIPGRDIRAPDNLRWGPPCVRRKTSHTQSKPPPNSVGKSAVESFCLLPGRAEAGNLPWASQNAHAMHDGYVISDFMIPRRVIRSILCEYTSAIIRPRGPSERLNVVSVMRNHCDLRWNALAPVHSVADHERWAGT